MASWKHLFRLHSVPSIVFFTSVISAFPAQSRAQSDLGLIGLRSVHNRYLQAHNPDGEMHASNEKRNQEETWHLVEIDKAKHEYALLNYRNNKFMSKKVNGCVPADMVTLDPSTRFTLVSGKAYGVLNAVAIKSIDGKFVGSLKPGDNEKECGGEVAAHDGGTPPMNDGNWAGWWVIDMVTDPPQPGVDIITAARNALNDVAAKFSAADVSAIIAAVAAAG